MDDSCGLVPSDGSELSSAAENATSDEEDDNDDSDNEPEVCRNSFINLILSINITTWLNIYLFSCIHVGNAL